MSMISITFTYTLEEISVSCTSIFSCTCSADSNQSPFELISSYRNKKKSAGEKSGLQCGWGTTAALFTTKTSGQTLLYLQQQWWGEETSHVCPKVPVFSSPCFSHVKKQAEILIQIYL